LYLIPLIVIGVLPWISNAGTDETQENGFFDGWKIEDVAIFEAVEGGSANHRWLLSDQQPSISLRNSVISWIIGSYLPIQVVLPCSPKPVSSRWLQDALSEQIARLSELFQHLSNAHQEIAERTVSG
jgi:hypothetical protein